MVKTVSSQQPISKASITKMIRGMQNTSMGYSLRITQQRSSYYHQHTEKSYPYHLNTTKKAQKMMMTKKQQKVIQLTPTKMNIHTPKKTSQQSVKNITSRTMATRLTPILPTSTSTSTPKSTSTSTSTPTPTPTPTLKTPLKVTRRSHVSSTPFTTSTRQTNRYRRSTRISLNRLSSDSTTFLIHLVTLPSQISSSTPMKPIVNINDTKYTPTPQHTPTPQLNTTITPITPQYYQPAQITMQFPKTYFTRSVNAKINAINSRNANINNQLAIQ